MKKKGAPPAKAAMTGEPPRFSDGALVRISSGAAAGRGAGGRGGPAVTAREMQRDILARARRRSGAHLPVLEEVRRRIRSRAGLDQVRMVYRVPDFVPGLPVYDVSDVAHGVADALREDGFVAEVYEPDTLYVSWDRAEIRGAPRAA